MHNIQILLSTLLLISICYSCSSKPKKNDEVNDSSRLACELCLIEYELEIMDKNKAIDIYPHYKNACDSNRISAWIKRYDTLKKEFEKRILKFNDDIYFAEEACSKRYPIHHVKDENKRDSLLFLLDVWNNIPRQKLIDTTCYEPDILNDKYFITNKGKKYELTKEEHDRAIINLRKGFNRLESYIEMQKLKVLQQLSGQENPDIYFRDILRRYAKHNSKTKNLDPQTDAPLEILKEFTQLAQEAGKLEY